jgi:hypothetical protein
MVCKFLRWLFTSNSKQNTNMAKDLTDLQNALNELSTAGQQNADASVAVLSAANAAVIRASNIPGQIDYTAQVDQVNAVKASLGLAVGNQNDATAAANSILP